MFVCTDSSGFPEYDRHSWNNDLAYPYIEAKCYYYKATCDIDCYPLILHHFRTEKASDIYEVLYNMTPAYVACEVNKISTKRSDELRKLIDTTPIDLIILMDDSRGFINDKLKTMNTCEFGENFVIGAIMRAMIDNLAYGIVSNELIGCC